MSDEKVGLSIDGYAAGQESLAGWDAEVFVLDGVARGVDAPAPRLALDPDAVLELELANGTRILVAAADAERYLGAAAGRGEGKPGEIAVGQVLHLAGPRQPAGAAREGLGAWVLKGLRVYRHGPAGMTALVAAGTYQDAQLDDHNGLYRCATEAWGLDPGGRAARIRRADAACLIHGTASSSEGSFRGPVGQRDVPRAARHDLWRAHLRAGAPHLTESPVANALALVKTLPKGARLHLVSHSRGGMVGELLARANRVDLEPFTDAEIDRFLAHAQRLGRDGFGDRCRASARTQPRAARARHHGSSASCASPARRAAPRWPRAGWTAGPASCSTCWARASTRRATLIPGLLPVAKGYDLLKNFLLAVVSERTDARILPGPGSDDARLAAGGPAQCART